MSLDLPANEERQQRFSSRSLRFLIAALLISLIGTTFAVNVTINGDNKVEFGSAFKNHPLTIRRPVEI